MIRRREESMVFQKLIHRVLVPLAACLIAMMGTPMAGQTGTDPEDRGAENGGRTILRDADWAMDTVHLKKGTVYRGLIESEDKQRVELLIIFRPPGRPMYAILLPIHRAEIEKIERLDTTQRAELSDRVVHFRYRARIDSLRQDLLDVKPAQRGSPYRWTYQARRGSEDWFVVQSTMDSRITRQAIARLEQIFTAFGRILPPSPETVARRRKPLEIVLFGSMSTYQDFVRSLGLEISNPAFYSTEKNMIAAGSQLTGYSQALERAKKKHAQLRAEYRGLADALPKKIEDLGEQLKRQSVPDEVLASVLAAERRRFEKQLDRMEQQIVVYDRRNAARFDELSRKMFVRIYHEAFHAYLENHVFDRRHHDVPRWLNEGLAQVFEQGQLENNSLRIDAPEPGVLARLQADLRLGEPLSLERLLKADQEAFLVSHGNGRGASSRHYLYCWGLAYYLAIEQGMLTREKLERYVRREGRDRGAASPVRRFEALVGTDLLRFERQWHAAMLALSARRPRGTSATGGPR